MRISDWSSDLCSSDLPGVYFGGRQNLLRAWRAGLSGHRLGDLLEHRLRQAPARGIDDYPAGGEKPAAHQRAELYAQDPRGDPRTAHRERVHKAADPDRKSTRLNSSH